MVFVHVTWACIIMMISMVQSQFLFDDDEFGERRTFGEAGSLIKRDSGLTKTHVSEITSDTTFTAGAHICNYKIKAKKQKLEYRSSDSIVRGSCTKIHVQSLLDKHFGEKKLLSTFPNLNGNNFEVVKFTYRYNTKTVRIRAKAKVPIALFGGGNLEFGKDSNDEPLTLELKWDEVENSDEWHGRDIEVVLRTNKVILSSASFKFKAKKMRGSPDLFKIMKFETAPGVGRFTVSAFTSAIAGLDNTAFGADFSQDKYGKLKWPDFKGYGYFDTAENFQLVLHPTRNVRNSNLFKNEVIKPFIILKNPREDDNTYVTLLVQFASSTNIKSTLDGIMTSVNADIGMIKRINNRKFCLTVTSGEYDFEFTDLRKDEVMMKPCFPLELQDAKSNPNDASKLKKKMTADINIHIEINFRTNVGECNTDQSIDTSSLPEMMTLNGNENWKGFIWTFPEQAKGPMMAIMKCMWSNRGGAFAGLPYSLPFADSDLVTISDFLDSPTEKTLSVKVTPPAEYQTIPVINLSFNYLEFTATYKIPERTWELSGLADMHIDKFEVFLKLEYSRTTKEGNEDSDDGEAKKKEKAKSDKKKQSKNSANKQSNMMAKLRKRKSVGSLPDIFDELKSSHTVFYDDIITPRSLTVSNQSANVSLNENIDMARKNISLAVEGSKRQGDEVEKQWTFTILMPSLLVKDIFKIFSPQSTLPNDYPKVFDNGMKNLQISWAWGSDFEVRFRGELVIMGWQKILLEAVFWKQQPSRSLKFGIGIYFMRIDLDAILKYIFQDDSISVPWLNSLDCKVVIGNSKGIKDLGKKKKKLKKIKSVMKVGKEKQKTDKSKSKNNANEMKRSLLPEMIEKRESDSDGDDEDEPEADIKFTYGSLADNDLINGAGFEMTWYSPTDDTQCKGDSLCKFISEKVQANTQFVFAAQIDSEGITISGELKDAGITLATDLKLDNAKVEIDARVGGGIKLSCDLIYNNKKIATNPLVFQGAIEVGFAGELTFRFTMIGTLDNPFGIKRVALSNLLIGASIDFKAAAFTIEFGVTVKLGELNKNPIEITGLFGLSPTNWLESWVYVKASRITIGDLGRAFNFNVPKGFKDEGFPEGFQFSLSRKEIDIESLGIVIPDGLYFVGKFKFKFVELSADCTIVPSRKSFDVKLEMNKQNWLGGMIQISSYSDPNKGPLFHVKVDKDTPFFAKIDGQVTILGLSIKVFIDIDENGAKFFVQGTPFPFLFDASIDVTAALDPVTKSFNGGEFKIDVRTSDFIPKLAKKIRDWMSGLKSDSEKAKTDGNAAISKGEADSARIERKKSTWDSALDIWERNLRNREAQLLAKQQAITGRMQTCIDQCEKVCVPFFDWEDNCFTILGWSAPCPWPNLCATKVPNYFCYAGCALDEIGSAFLTWVESTLTKIGLAIKSTAVFLGEIVDGIAAALTKLKEFMIEAKDWFIVQFQNLLSFITKLLTDDIVLRKLKLEATVRPPFKYCFGYDIDITLFTWHITDGGNVCLDTLIRDLIYSLFGYNAESRKVLDVPDKIEQAKGKTESIKEATEELEESASTAQAEIDMETAKTYEEDLNQKRTMPTQKMFKFIDEKSKDTDYSEAHQRIMDTPHGMPAYEIHNDEMIENLEKRSPWVVVKSFKDGNSSLEPQRTADHEVAKRSLSFDYESKPCGRLKRSLATYDTIANVLRRSARNLENMEKNHFSHKEFHRNGIKKLDKRIAELELYNMTQDQREDAYFWYNKADQGYEDLHNNIKRNIDYHNNYALPILHNQLNYILKKSGKEGGFIKHVEDMHGEALNDVKRSIKSDKDQVNGQEILGNIKKSIVGIVTDENSPLSRHTRSIDGMKNDITEMNKIALAC